MCFRNHIVLVVSCCYALCHCTLMSCASILCHRPVIYHANKMPTLAVTPAPTPSSSSKPYSWLPDGNYLTTVNDQIIDQNGNAVTLHGIAWYGFGDPSTAMVEGLSYSNGYDSQTQDFATVVVRMKALGFNTIKLPFSFGALNAGSTTPYPSSCNLADSTTLMNNLEEGGKGDFSASASLSVMLSRHGSLHLPAAVHQHFVPDCCQYPNMYNIRIHFRFLGGLPQQTASIVVAWQLLTSLCTLNSLRTSVAKTAQAACLSVKMHLLQPGRLTCLH